MAKIEKTYEGFVRCNEASERVEKMIKKIDVYSDRNKYWPIQIETVDNSHNEELQRYLWEIADIKDIDAIGGTEAPVGARRYCITDKVEFEDIIHMAPTGIACGIKVVKYPIGTLMEYQTWPGGYIEGFIRMKSDDQRFGQYFIWTYIKMEKLADILEKFEGRIEALEDL